MELELMNRVKEQREQLVQVVATFEDEKTRLIKNGGSVTEENSNMVRSLLSAIERKVEEEVGNR